MSMKKVRVRSYIVAISLVEQLDTGNIVIFTA